MSFLSVPLFHSALLLSSLKGMWFCVQCYKYALVVDKMRLLISLHGIPNILVGQYVNVGVGTLQPQLINRLDLACGKSRDPAHSSHSSSGGIHGREVGRGCPCACHIQFILCCSRGGISRVPTSAFFFLFPLQLIVRRCGPMAGAWLQAAACGSKRFPTPVTSVFGIAGNYLVC